MLYCNRKFSYLFLLGLKGFYIFLFSIFVVFQITIIQHSSNSDKKLIKKIYFWMIFKVIDTFYFLELHCFYWSKHLASSWNSLLAKNERNSHPQNVESHRWYENTLTNLATYSMGKSFFLLCLQRIRAHNSTQDYTMISPFIWPN